MSWLTKMFDMGDRGVSKSQISSLSFPISLYESIDMNPLNSDGLKGSITNEETLRVLVEKLTERNQLLEQQLSDLKFEFDHFTHNLTRSIRVPFLSIIALTDGLVKNCSSSLGKYGQSYCDNIVYSADNIEKIMIDLFQYHRLGTAEIEMTEFELSVVVNQVLNDYRKLIDFRNASIIVDDKLAKVFSSRPVLYQIIHHLVLYNLDNTEQNVRPIIHIYSQNDQNVVKLFIHTNGKTPATRVLELLNSENGEFGFFEQNEQSGIGLSIVRKGCNLLKLKFCATVIPDEGNLFLIQFNPLKIVEDTKE